ncbi:MAG: DUF4346 domain-containing protein [Candidatus Nanoarchaeia archaeon]
MKSNQRKPPLKKIEAKKIVKEWKLDEKGYFLIEPRIKEQIIYAHHYHANKKYNTSIVGTNAEEIYYTIIREQLVGTLLHAAYIGSELQKAQFYIETKKEGYVQDDKVNYNE